MQWNLGPEANTNFFLSYVWGLEIQIVDFACTPRCIASGSVTWFIMNRNISWKERNKQTNRNRKKKNSY